MQANKLICHIPWKLAEYKTPGSETNYLTVYNTTGSTRHVCPGSPYPLILQVPQGQYGQQHQYGVTAKQSLREENLTILFNIKGLLKSCPYSAPEKDIIFIILDSKLTCSLLWEPLLLCFKAVCCTNILEKIAQNESCPSLCSQDKQTNKKGTP